MHIGDKLISFNLLSTSGEYINNFDFADKYSLLLIVTCNHCKYANAYWKRLIQLSEDYEEDSLGVAAICGNNAETQTPTLEWAFSLVEMKPCATPF